MSGTSYDGIDIAVVDLALVGDTLQMAVLGHSLMAYDAELQEGIAAALPPHTTSVEAVVRLDTAIGQVFGTAAVRALEEFCGGEADLVVSHGQTLFHWRQDGRTRGSLQLGEPAWIAERCGLPVVSGLRARDIAAGGEGAPLVSMLDVLLLGQHRLPTVALNLGGIANITAVRPDAEPLAYDTGPGNALIDAAAGFFSDGAQSYDAGGAWAASGNVHTKLLDRLLDDAFLREPPPKSTGKERYHLPYLLKALDAVGSVEPADVMATVTDLSVRTVAAECQAHEPAGVVVSGGGMYNEVLMQGLTNALHPIPVDPIDRLGIPAKAKEAIAFAVLGFLTISGLPGTIPSCTGAGRATLLGNLTPGRRPLRLPGPSRAAPRRLLIAP
jgi:anhydro-N-acetylmuramic acid kinase